MKNLKPDIKDVVGKNAGSVSAAPKRAWKDWLIAGSTLALAGCGSVDVENFVPMPSRRDGAADFRLDGAVKADAHMDLPKNDFRSDVKLPDGFKPLDGVAAKDGQKDGAKSEGKAADAKSADKSIADACIVVQSTLACSNSSALVSGWLSLGGTLDLKGSSSFMTTVYSLRFEGVEMKNGTTSAIVSLYDSCGKALTAKGVKIVAGTTEPITLNGQRMDVTAEEVYGGVTAADSAVQSGLAKISVKVPCNLDGGASDKKSGDSKSAESKPADLKVSVDAVKKDSAKSDAVASDAGIQTEARPPRPDAAKTDAKTACSAAKTGTFSGTIHTATPQPVGGYVFDYNGKNGSGAALFTITCGGSVVKTNYVCPVGVNTPIEVPEDGKRLRITPYPWSSDTLVNVAITVENF